MCYNFTVSRVERNEGGGGGRSKAVRAKSIPARNCAVKWAEIAFVWRKGKVEIRVGDARRSRQSRNRAFAHARRCFSPPHPRGLSAVAEFAYL